MTKTDQKRIYSIFDSERAVLYHPGLIRLLGSVSAAQMLGQLLYWNGLGANPEWLYKTIEEFEQETGLSKHKQYSAQKLLTRLGYIEVRYKGIPRTRQMRVMVDKLEENILSQTKTSRLVLNNSDGSKDYTNPTITKSTHRTTTKIQNLDNVRKVEEIKRSYGSIKSIPP